MTSLVALALVVCLFACLCGGQRWDNSRIYPDVADRGNSTGYDPDSNREGAYGQRHVGPYGYGSRDQERYRPGAGIPGNNRPRTDMRGSDRQGSYGTEADRQGSYMPERGDYEPDRFNNYRPAARGPQINGPQRFGPDARGQSNYMPGGYVPGDYGPNAGGPGGYGPGMGVRRMPRYEPYLPRNAVWVNPENVVATTATRTSDQYFSKRRTVVFDSVVTNISGGYNRLRGVFTAPVPGCYIISYNVQTKTASRKPAHVELTRNGVVINSAKAKGDYSTSANFAVLILNQFDRISLQGRAGTAIGCAKDDCCTFSIVLVRAGKFTDQKVARAFSWW